MKTRSRLIAEALGGALFLSACGGGGGGSSTPASPQTPASVDVTLTPSLGKFSTGCSVELRTGSGTLLGSAPITDAGNAFIRVTGYSGPVIAQVKGASGCTYFDEATASQVPFGADRSLSAVSDTLRVDQGINVLTHLAASRVLDGDKLATGKTADTVKLENLTIQRMFQVADMFAAPTLLGNASDRLDNTAAGQLAVQLAALSELAHTRATDVATLAATLATDLADGTLDTFGASEYQVAAQTTVAKLASPSAQASLLILSQTPSLIVSTRDVQSDVQKVIAAGPALAQAKQLFADLRTSVLALSNSAGTGTLDAENALLKADFQHGLGVDMLIDGVKFMLESASQFFDSGTSRPGSTHSGWVGTCYQDSTTQATCHVSGVDDGSVYTSYQVRLTKTGAGTASWAFTQVYRYQNGQSTQTAAPSGMSGSFTYSANAATAKGQFIPMTGDAERSAIDISLGFTTTGTTGAIRFSATGSANSVKTDGTSTLQVDLTKLDLDPVSQVNQMVLSLTGPRHRFDGALTLSGQVASADGSIAQPKSLKFVGTFTDTASHYTVLDGTVTASQDWTGYDPRLANSDGNFARYAFSFDGVANKGPGAAGITLSFSGDNQAGPHDQKIALKFTSASGIVVTGTGVQTPARPDDLWNWTFANENGIKATYAQSSRSGKVTAGDGSDLGTLSSQRVTFVDGSFESLL